MDAIKIKTDYIYWENRRGFFDLMEEFSNSNMSSDDFIFEFTQLSEDCAKKTYEPFNEENLPLAKFEGFSSFIVEISLQCEFVVPGISEKEYFKENFGYQMVTEEELKTLVSKLSIEVKKYLE